MDNDYGNSTLRIEQRGQADTTRDVELQPALNLFRDRVHWGSVLAGLVVAVSTQTLLSLLGIASGLTQINTGSTNWLDASAANFSQFMMIWSAVTALIAFFLGGYVASHTAAVFSRSWGALNGAMVFLIAIPLTLWMATSGLGALFGSLGNFAAMLNIEPAQIQQTLDNVTSPGQALANVSPQDREQAAAVARNAAAGVLGAMLLGLIASALGGLLGTRRALEVDQRTGNVSDT